MWEARAIMPCITVAVRCSSSSVPRTSPASLPERPRTGYNLSCVLPSALQKQQASIDNKTDMHLRGASVVLASASPERRSILIALADQCKFASLSFAVSGFAEDIPHAGLKPLEYAQLTARKKAEFALAAHRQADVTIISADSIVVLPVSTRFYLAEWRDRGEAWEPHPRRRAASPVPWTAHSCSHGRVRCEKVRRRG